MSVVSAAHLEEINRSLQQQAATLQQIAKLLEQLLEETKWVSGAPSRGKKGKT